MLGLPSLWGPPVTPTGHSARPPAPGRPVGSLAAPRKTRTTSEVAVSAETFNNKCGGEPSSQGILVVSVFMNKFVYVHTP